MAYNYLGQSMVGSYLIQQDGNDSFFNPSNNHTGYAADGNMYQNGVLITGAAPPSWYTEPFGQYRGGSQAFPLAALVLLSRVSLVILDETSGALTLWLQALLSDGFALTNNFDSTLVGFMPSSITYANGKITVLYNPDPGSLAITNTMAITMDFTQDNVYLVTAVEPTSGVIIITPPVVVPAPTNTSGEGGPE